MYFYRDPLRLVIYEADIHKLASNELTLYSRIETKMASGSKVVNVTHNLSAQRLTVKATLMSDRL